MIPTYRYSVLSSSSHSMMMPFDLNQEDQTHNFFTTNHNNNTNHFSSSSSSLSFPILFNPNIQGASYYSDQPNHLPSDQEAEKNIILPSRGSSWDLHQEAGKDENKSGIKLKLWKKEDGGNNENLRGEEDDGSVKWMSSKMRMMRRMMVPDQTSSDNKNKFVEEAKQQPLSPLLGADDNSTNNSSNHSNNNNNITVRVCSDCHTTKTPLWRSGPRGPKSLCNACGIRQRKARRAMAAAAAEAASANGIIPTASETYDNDVKGKKLHKKEKKKKKLIAECEDDDDDDDEEEDEPQMKKKRKLGGAKASCHRGRKKFGFDDLTINLSKNLALQVFPQDEKEAAILLMALSYGMLHGFPSDRYLN